ncbi:hypothetical protein THRCLA_22713 [Thraustotheca clavata]|uniref:Uncharacterized protein n=1 Tax=Thraustotheca clavata TaxID=74557 RepID=A0A1V9YUA8_9STRA|nr:hypothetical protein THRCLA_22713 [Thraustotheca clavata]
MEDHSFMLLSLRNTPYWISDIEIKQFLAAPMENMWLDELVDCLLYPIALARASVAKSHLTLLEYLIKTFGPEITHFTSVNNAHAMDVAAQHEHLNIVKYLHTIGGHTCSTMAMEPKSISRLSSGYIKIELKGVHHQLWIKLSIMVNLKSFNT